MGSFWKYRRVERRLPFQITWFSFVFPNTALVTATEALGQAFASDALRITGCVLAALLVAVWALLVVVMIRSLWRKELLWPKDED